MLRALTAKIQAVGEEVRSRPVICGKCNKKMGLHDVPSVSWLTRFGKLLALSPRFRCEMCHEECHPLIDALGVEPGRISGSLARLLALLATVVPYDLAATLAHLFFGVRVSPMGVWRVVQRMGEASACFDEALAHYHADSRSTSPSPSNAPDAVVLGVDGCALGMQVRSTRRRRATPDEVLKPLPPLEEGHFREVKTGVLLLPCERIEPAPGRHSVLRRVLVTCLGDADAIFGHLWARMQELEWLGPQTIVVIVGDGAEWIWKRAELFTRRCEILDFWHAVEHAWQFARMKYGEESKLAARFISRLARDLRAGKVRKVISQLKTIETKTPQERKELDDLIRYYTNNAERMRYDEYLRLGYGIGSGAVESAHKQVVHARLRQAGMRWSEAGARRLLALRVMLLNGEWSRLDRMRMVPLAS
jgi:hypothetical protein